MTIRNAVIAGLLLGLCGCAEEGGNKGTGGAGGSTSTGGTGGTSDATGPAVDARPTDVAVATVGDTSATTFETMDATGPAVDARPTDVAVATVGDTSAPTFETIYETILVPRCTSCHGADARWSALVMPDAPTALRNLVNVPVKSRWIELCAKVAQGLAFSDLRRVRPFNPDASMLYFLPRCYVRDALHSTMTETERAMIRSWINAGAM